MAEEEKGQSLAGNAEPAPQATQTIAPAVEPELPERFRGKSATEIAKAHEELERKLGEQGRQLGAYKEQLESYDLELARIRNLGQATQTRQVQQPQQVTDDYWYEKPIEATRQLAREETQRELQNFRQAMRYEEGARSFGRTLAEVKRTEPEIFGDPEIEEGVRKFVEYGVKNQGLDPMVQSDPMALVAIGNHLRYLKGKRNPQYNPTMPVMTESPTAVRRSEPVKAEPQFTSTERSFLEYMKDRAPELGLDKKENLVKLLEEES